MSRRLLDAFIRALPWSFRDEFGPEMKGVFEEEVAAARARGGRAAVAWLWLRTTRDLLVLAARQHGSDLARDLRHGWRGLRANPAFTAGAMLTLTLGMAPATVVFSVLDAVVLEPLPYPDSERLVAVWGTNPGRTAREMPLSMPNVADVMATQTSLEALGAHAASSFTLTGEGEPERVRGALVTPGVLRALGVQPVAGRLFADDEDDPGTEPVAILSHGLWQRRFGGRADVIGRSMPIDGRPVPIVGVMPDEFNFPSRAALWMPLVFDLQSMPRGSNFASAVGRLKFGLSLAQAEAELHGIAASIARDNMDTAANFRLYLTPLQDDVIGDAPRVLSTVAAGLAFVLLVACANVAGLLIVRTSGRERELAIRLTLGAHRSRLVRQLLAESLLLVGIGGACALLLGRWLLAVIQRSQALNLPRIADASFDARMLVFLLAILACVAVVLTIAGAQRLADADPARALAGAGRAAGSRRATRVRGALVVAQFAFALVLVTGAGLLLRSTARLLAVNPGFSSERVLTFRIVLPAARYPELAHRAAFFNEVVSRLRQSPGVEVASSAGYAPMSGSYSSRRFAIIGRPLPPPGQEPFATDSPVGPDYFRVMGIPLIAGRPITERDHSQAPPVVVVSESFARTHFSDASAVGQRIRFYSGRAGAEPPAPREIVGVVGDVRQRAVAEAPLPQLYVPHGQMPWGFGSFVVRVEPGRDPQSIAAGAKRAVAQVDPEQAAYDFRAVDDLVSDGSARHRALAALLTGLALVALTLAAIGIHGVISTSVRQRTREIAVRVALGAGEREVVGAIVKEGLILAVIGAAAGLAGAMALTQLLRALLFEVAPGDPLTFGAGIALLIAVALAACAWPARRALRLDPATALRSE